MHRGGSVWFRKDTLYTFVGSWCWVSDVFRTRLPQYLNARPVSVFYTFGVLIAFAKVPPMVWKAHSVSFKLPQARMPFHWLLQRCIRTVASFITSPSHQRPCTGHPRNLICRCRTLLWEDRVQHQKPLIVSHAASNANMYFLFSRVVGNWVVSKN